MPFDGPSLPRVLARPLTQDDQQQLARLRAARARIASRWRWRKYNGRICLYAPWVYCAQEAIGPPTDANIRCLARLARNLPEPWRSIAAFNDAPETTHADVLGVYDRTIAELER